MIKVKVNECSEQQLDVYKTLITRDDPSLCSDYKALADEISKKFNVEVTERDLLIAESPTIMEEEEDLRLIYKHYVR